MIKAPTPAPRQDEYIKTSLRLPAALHTEILAAAEYNGRSMNAELIARLQDNPLDAVRRENAELKSMVREILDLVRDKF